MEKLTSSNQVTFTAEALSVGYGSSAKIQPVVKNVNLDIKPGKLTILIGSNGCGKSTLLKCMARVLKPMSGKILLNGEDINKQNPKSVAKQLALLPQGPIAPEGLTVKQLVAQGRYPHQSFFQQWSSEDEEAVLEAMQMANVEELQDRPISEMSGGQRQRCWIAMVLAQQTDIILLDEPTTYLDLKVQVDLLSLLSRLAHDYGRTLVVVLHELNLAASYADHLVMVKNGEIYAQGTPEAVFTDQNLFEVFGLQAKVFTEPETGSKICIPTAVPQRNT
ncbi:putative siderophore transport system ATP-binding protein YusV [Vibrio inusitatus NBRC 102082]|uniref:Putative siderophore transport system ATP-binding protein YusV n=1 Tax=Vibrio inusitatus NBRC 102082 TaxID=1219070 RepID=A0A4Y3HYC8_9VIBR|nr:ABC transporter ATP-binding protein [Vibrio inusitatus]GEA51991.1 putative siderophore transport system ATP-binding protein YusV [Vibrio inusitatus NBRC 102082]